MAVLVRMAVQMPDYSWVDLLRMTRSTDEKPRAEHLAPGRLDRAVAEARGGDATAFRLLYREFQPLLLRYLRFLAGDRAEDIAARTWQRVAAELRGHRGDYQAFRGWAAGIGRELAGDGLAGDGLASDGAEAGAGQGWRGPGPPVTAGDVLAEDDTDAALRMITRLPPDEAEAVLLRSVVGLDARRAAKVMSQRPRAVRAAARRGLAALGSQL
jgi:RNA polymerase sigma-70 factor (ECF subfamily)